MHDSDAQERGPRMLPETETGNPNRESVAVTPLLEIADVRHEVRGERQKTTNLILSDVSLRARAGEFISIVGPSGCGKSTLLNLISGLAKPTSGTIKIEGQQVAGVRPDVGFIFQQDALLPWRTAAENVQLALKFRGVPKAERRRRASEWMDRFGLGALHERYPREMSGGQRKRAAIAATLVYEPRLLLMDEPFSALDVQTRDFIETDVLSAWSQTQGQTALFVTHDLEEAIALSDRVVVMSQSPGTIVSDYAVDIPRPRSIMDVRTTEHFQDLHKMIWADLRKQVLQGAAPGKGQ
jgi:NitT/TauT family transport system ATP-binding protein